MSESKIFDGISQTAQAEIYECFAAKKRRFFTGQQILTYSEHLNNVCIILSGSAHVYSLDPDGNCLVLEHLTKDDVFGEVFHFPIKGAEYIAEADEPCEIMFISYERIVHPCVKACPKHTLLINNLFALTAEKIQDLELRINVLAQRSIRQKLLTFLEYTEHDANGEKFSIGMTVTELASYINVDRSSLMREIRRMKDEGILWSKGRWFRLNLTEIR